MGFWKLKKMRLICVSLPSAGAPGRSPWKIWSIPIDARHCWARLCAVPSKR
jgi:hypothetical protein